MKDLMDVLEGKDFSINVISKSGTTTEPALAFRIFRKLLEEKYGKEEARKRIYATTDKARGALKTLADNEGYETFVIPDDVGGRFSVLTPVGLLPIAVSGLNIEEMMKGAAAGHDDFGTSELEENPAYQYAVVRNALYNKGKQLKCLLTMSQHFNTSLSGGNSYLVKVKEKIKKAFSHLQQTSQLIYTH